MFRTFVAAALASLFLFSMPAKASLIQGFSFSGTNVSGSGTVEFGAGGGILDLDFPGNAYGGAFNFVDITGTATLDGADNVQDWFWADDFVTPSNSAVFITGFDAGLIIFFCEDQTQDLVPTGCNGAETDAQNLTVTFDNASAVSEPTGMALLATGLLALGLARRHRVLKIAA